MASNAATCARSRRRPRLPGGTRAARGAGQAINVGSGVGRRVEDVGRALARAIGRADLHPQITGRYRAGDIRHCFADITLASSLLRFEPAEDFDLALCELADWLAGEVAIDRVDEATAELTRRGLVA